MAEAPAAPSGGGPMKQITRKIGPLPMWGWAAILVVGFVLYRRMKGGSGSSTPAPTDTSQTDQNTYVPGFDAAGAGGGGGIGSTGLGGTINNYYYGDQAAQQANGGGTSSNPGPGQPTRGGILTPGGGFSSGPPSAGGIHYFGPGGSGVYYPPVVQPVGTPHVAEATPYRSGTMPFVAS